MKANTKTSISDAEWEIMDLVWDHAPVTAQEVVAQLGPVKGWSHKTIGTFLNRLTKKGAVRFKREGRRYLFYPAVTRNACVRKESRSFLDRVFSGQAEALLAHFVNEADLSPAAIAELETILKKKGR
jgi:BlaI family penicillinase repressor